MSGISLETLALRVQLPGFVGVVLPPDYAVLLAEGLGGVCYFASNTADGPEAVAALGVAIRNAHPRAVIAVDEEGGDVTRFHVTQGSPVLGPAALGAADDVELTRASGRAIGAELAAGGVNLCLGPVADVNTNPDNPVIGTRSFGADPDLVAAHVSAWVKGLQESGVAACVKHFPGHGDTAQDSHLELPTLDADPGALQARELVPFRAAIEAGAAAVMTSHIVVPSIDPRLPATLSASLLSLLREDLGHDGVIVSDALDMAGASAGRGIAQAAVPSLVAGADLLCIGPDKPGSLVREIQAAIVAAVNDGSLSRTRLEGAVARIDTMLDPLQPGLTCEVDLLSQVAGARAALLVEGVLPDLAGAEIVSVATTANIAVGAARWGLRPDRVVEPGEPFASARPVVLQVRDAHRHPDLVVADAAAIIEWGWPGPYDGAVPRICTRGYSRPGAVAVSELLREAGWDR